MLINFAVLVREEALQQGLCSKNELVQDELCVNGTCGAETHVQQIGGEREEWMELEIFFDKSDEW